VEECFSQLLNVHRFSDVRQTEIHTPFEVEIAIADLKKNNSPGSDQISEEIIQAGDETLRSAIHKLINSIWNKGELSGRRKESIIVQI
jgi:hypothetical protein